MIPYILKKYTQKYFRKVIDAALHLYTLKTIVLRKNTNYGLCPINTDRVVLTYFCVS